MKIILKGRANEYISISKRKKKDYLVFMSNEICIKFVV